MGIIFCFLPIIITFIVITVKSEIKVTHSLVACLLGLVAVLPISFIQFFIPDFSMFFKSLILYSLLTSFILYGLIEELLKMVLLLPLPHKNYGPKEYLILAILMGLTLGCFESVVYFFTHLQTATSRGAQLLYGQIFVRIFTADIIHVTCTGLSAMFIYSCRTGKRKLSPLIWAVLLHGLYDFFAGFNSPLRYFSLVVVLLAIAECRIKYIDQKKLTE